MICTLDTPKATYQLGSLLATHYIKDQVFFLKGELGAGKTTFAQGFIQSVGASDRVKSPTYTLIETYATPMQHILHLDLYRLQDPQELETIGIRDYTLMAATWLIEWPENGLDYLPSPDMTLTFTFFKHAHQVQFEAWTPEATVLLQKILPMIMN